MELKTNEIVIFLPTDQAGDLTMPLSEPAAGIFLHMASVSYFFTGFWETHGNSVKCCFEYMGRNSVGTCTERARIVIAGEAAE